MLLPVSLLSYLCAASALSITPNLPSQYTFSNPPAHDETYDIPTIHESAVMARRILSLTNIGTLVTSFPDTNSASDQDVETQENRPPGVENSPIGLMEYMADCEGDGNPTILAINIATPFKNYDQGSNISLGVRWWPVRSGFYTTFDDPEIPTPHTPAALPRFSLHGRLEPISRYELITKYIPACFIRYHPDSVLWQPGNDISHESEYMRFVADYVYWFGGFGDRARIGWLPIEEWRSVTKEEIEDCRLPGEKEKDRSRAEGWKEGL